METILMYTVVEQRRRELAELLRQSGYDVATGPSRVARLRPLARLRRALPGVRVQHSSPV